MFNYLGSTGKVFARNTNSNSSPFEKDLNEEQVEAMIHLFLLVMMADESVLNIKMYNYIHKQFEILGLDLKTIYKHKYASKADELTYNVLKYLDLDQRKWFATVLHTMLFKIGVKPSKTQINLYNVIGEKSSNPFIKKVSFFD